MVIEMVLFILEVVIVLQVPSVTSADIDAALCRLQPHTSHTAMIHCNCSLVPTRLQLQCIMYVKYVVAICTEQRQYLHIEVVHTVPYIHRR